MKNVYECVYVYTVFIFYNYIMITEVHYCFEEVHK